MNSPLSYMALQVGTLYKLDERGRLLCSNEPGDPPAPRFFLGRTPEGNIWRVRYDLPDSLAAELERLCRAEPVVAEFSAPPVGYDAIRAVLEEHAPLGDEYRGPCYRFPDQLPAPDGRAVAVTADNSDVLLPHFPWLVKAVSHMPIAAALEDGRAVAACWCSRLAERACEAGVETVPGHQRRGYAAAAVGLWGQLVQASGRLPLYSTEWGNLASQGVARRLGLIMYGEDFSLG
ncbi:MAG: GNAT family N-acetyltransferase [Chloroflexota bacterium]|nr:MAG: GNAT family N-acetyltransferase [Chloroflexota bacterium]